MQYLGIDWGTPEAAWCASDECGAMVEDTRCARSWCTGSAST